MEWIKRYKSIIIGIGVLLLGLIAVLFSVGQRKIRSSVSVRTEAGTVGLIRLSEETERTYAAQIEPEPEKESTGSTEEAASQKGTENADLKPASTETEVPVGTSASSDTQTEPQEAAEPETEADQTPSFTCTLSISCTDVLEHMDTLNPAKAGIIPENGYILGTTTVSVTEGETVYDVLRRTCMNAGIPLDANYFPMYGSAYVKGINNLYEFDCGNLSGWKYSVNGVSPNYGCSAYVLREGDSIQWYYSCNMNE